MTKAIKFKKKAAEIIMESIKSVVYIDEKAWNPFDGTIFKKDINEHGISKQLYKNLKQQGINLNVHQFHPGEEDLPINHTLKRYLFNDIDLVLLDWDLDDVELNTTALKLLNDVIIQPHIHFCCIYSASPAFDDIIKKVKSYFSGYSKADYDQISALFEDNDEIVEIINKVDITSSPQGAMVGEIMKIDNSILSEVTKITKVDKVHSLIPMAISINKALSKSVTALEYPLEIISEVNSEHTLIINNTIIAILNKGKNRPENFINNFSNHVAKDKTKSFFKLLGLDMQNQFSKYGAFINPEILNISFNTFMHHRVQINASGTRPSFEDFIKDLFIENSKLNLLNADLKLLHNGFLDEFKAVKKHLTNQELALVNCFYNGAKLIGNKALNFGDIFLDEEHNSYYLCITALCDCLHPDKIKNKFFFVKNTGLISIDKAIKLGDTSHISYIDDSVCVKWSGDDEFVKPRQYYISNNIINNFTLSINDWDGGKPVSRTIKYVFTLKQNYAQRIANQAFSHPMRVGVDFVKM